jgi:cytochrome P450
MKPSPPPGPPAVRGDATARTAGTPAGSLRAARARDRRVYLYGYPVTFALLAASRRRGALRLGKTIIVNDTEAYREALTGLKLDRLGGRTVGGTAREIARGDLLFDQEGEGHKHARRTLSGLLGAEGVAKLRPVWRGVLSRRLAPLGGDGEVDMVAVARELAAATACALLGTDADPLAVASAAGALASAAVRARLPGRRAAGVAREADRLSGLLGRADALGTMLAVAAVNTTVAAVPRSVAWCADAGLWSQAADDQLRGPLADELLRVIAPSPLLPRIAAAGGTVGGLPVRPGDRLLLVARHAARAHIDPPDCLHPAGPAVAHLVFGTGSHTCPGARLARAQLADTLSELAPYRPVVVRARVDRRAALPAWRSLIIRAQAR